MQDLRKTPRPGPLYPPEFIFWITLIFTPIFGGLMQAANWRAMAKRDEARASALWARLSLWMVALFMGAQLIFRNEPWIGYVGPWFMFVLWAAWAVANGRRQPAYVKRVFANDYPRRPIGKALVIGAAGWLAYMALSVTMAMGLYIFGFEPLTPPPESGVKISLPEGAKEPVVTPLPAKPDHAAGDEKPAP